MNFRNGKVIVPEPEMFTQICFDDYAFTKKGA